MARFARVSASYPAKVGATEGSGDDGAAQAEPASAPPQEIATYSGDKCAVRNKRTGRGRNHRTGEDLTIDARKVVTFICSRTLKSGISL